MEQFVYTNEGRVLLREANQDDISKIYEMYQATNPEDWWEEENLSEFRFNLIKEAKGRIFIALLKDEVIGHAEVVLPESKDDPVYLVRLNIHDDFGRRKFGIELVRYSAIIMKNLGYKSYVTWPDTNKSKGLYKKVGLKEIKENPQMLLTIKDKKRTEVEVVKELKFNEEPENLQLVVGCPWARDYIWLKAFKAGEEELLDYRGPYVHQISFEGVEGVTLLDGNSVYIYLPEAEKDNIEMIEELLIYSSNLALDNGIENLHINIKDELWSQLDLSDIWEIDKEEERLEMKMEF
ncbi:acyltransferase [Orenia metallireducens]|uniref:Acyltransferase n=1 Tax=Orenia metallireducens TaxID=1413210 RepID=A0A1C0ABZ6_9FIRM|nr:GNAT family N-acetyltransferase [Orenia metallireducens]OCL27897.1 acyltransferase [Orenia metallireducens]